MESETEIKLSNQDFKFFKSECQKWIDTFGLKSWKVYYKFGDAHVDDEMAACETNYTSRAAHIFLSKVWTFNYKIDLDITESLQRCALHEVLELLMSPICSMAKSRYWDDTEFEKEKHMVIRTLEKSLSNKQEKNG